MTNRFALALGCWLLSLAARAERPPMQADFDRCATAMLNSGAGADLQGQLRMELLVRRDGRVYAAYISQEKGITNRKLERCLTSQALLWRLPDVPIDYARSYGWVSFLPSTSENVGSVDNGTQGMGQSRASVMMPDINSPPPAEPADLEVARQTVDVAELATTAEHGQAELALRNYPDAIKLFRDALQQNATDQTALRGLAQALAESGGDLAEARTLAQRLIQLAPDSVGGHEALLRVCLAAKDARCAFAEWKPANSARDFSTRSRVFKEQLEAPVKQAAAELRAGGAAAAPQPGGQPAADPCAGAQSEDQAALCVVKKCVDAGSADYARELSEQNHVEYAPGEWKVKAVGQGKFLISRQIATHETPPQQHNPIWLVKMGDNLVMQPSNAEARQITLTHNACASRVTSGQ